MDRKLLVICFGLMVATCLASPEVNSTDNKDFLPSTCHSGGCEEGRTFGLARRRMAMFFLPVMFKLGVIVTLLVGLTVLAFKGLTIGVILLIFAFGGLFSKLKAAKGYEHGGGGGPIHVHVHGPANPHQYHPPSYSYSAPPYSPGSFDRMDESASSFWEEYMTRKLQSSYPYSQ